jgi:hypothetical protein
VQRALNGVATRVVADLAEARRVAAAWAGATAGSVPKEVWADLLAGRISPAPTVRRTDRPVRGAPRQRYAIVEHAGARSARRRVTAKNWPSDWSGFGDTFTQWSLWLGGLDGQGRIPQGAGQDAGGWHTRIEVDDYDAGMVVSWTVLPGGDSDDPVYPPTDDAWLASVLRSLVAAAEPDFASSSPGFAGLTGFEMAARGDSCLTLPAAAQVLRGYEWITVAAAPVVERLGGHDALKDSGAFWSVEPLAGGGAWLQATERLAEYDLARSAAVLEVLRPALPDRPVLPDVANPDPWLVPGRTGLLPDTGRLPR